MAQYVRLSPGVWRDTKTGKTIQSVKDPNQAKPKTPAGEQKIPNPLGVKGQANQEIVNTQQELAHQGGEMALDYLKDSQLQTPFQPVMSDRTTTGNLEADRARIEEAAYGRLTRDFGNRDRQEGMDFATSLQNRGIPYSADPNSRYQQELRDMQRRQDDRYAGARSDAVMMGGQEYQRDFNINEQLRQNQYNEQAGIRNQQQQEIGGLSGMGQQGITNYNDLRSLQLQQQQIQAAIDQLKRRGGGGGVSSGGGGGSRPVDQGGPFYSL